MAVNPPSRNELLRLVHHTEARLRLIAGMLPDHSRLVRLRLHQLADRLARMLDREEAGGDD